MKTFKCPLCGGLLEHIEEGYLHIVQCQDCLLAAQGAMTEEKAWTNAKNLLADFPRIMRVQVGDRIRHLYQFNPYRGTPRIVEEVNVQEGWIRATGNKPILRPNEITTRPWELEEKGEQQ